MAIPEDELRRLKTFMGEMKLAQFDMSYRGDPTKYSGGWKAAWRHLHVDRVVTFATRMGNPMRRVVNLEYGRHSRKKPWRVHRRGGRTSYKHLDSALDAVSRYLKEGIL